jgi:maltose alpha-D-glucosyltransferase/alpha-amylase
MAPSLVKNDPDKKAVSLLWNEMREWKDKNYPECVLISEWSDPAVAIPAGFNIDFTIHFGIKGYPSLFFARNTPWGQGRDYDYCYFDRSGRGSISEFIDNYTKAYTATKDKGYIAIPTANHDYQRPHVAERNTLDQLKVAMTFFLTMPGVPFIYYGDEIAMKYQMDLPSKEGSNDRAGTRTPMQWKNDQTAGFSTCTPDNLYFPVDTENGRLTVETQEDDPNSMLNFVRRLTALRHSSKALGNDGDWQLLSDVSQPYPMVYQRTLGNETYVIALNPSGNKVSAPLHLSGAEPVLTGGKASVGKNRLSLNAFTAIILKTNNK